jgi:hypothetical protein
MSADACGPPPSLKLHSYGDIKLYPTGMGIAILTHGFWKTYYMIRKI